MNHFKRNLYDRDGAIELFAQLGTEFACVQNPSYIHPPYELYPLAPKIVQPVPSLAAVVCDMDGTTTTTEPICLHALEYMIRRLSGRIEKQQWEGLSREEDYPHIIGNSTTCHVEYLIEKYGGMLEREAFLSALLESILWNVAIGKDDNRRCEALETASCLGLDALVHAPATQALIVAADLDLEQIAAYSREATRDLARDFEVGTTHDLVRGAIEIYSVRYHQILEEVARGRGEALARQLLGDGASHLIEPMPGVALFLAAVKGWIGADEAGRLFDALADELIAQRPGEWVDHATDASDRPIMRRGFVAACQQFTVSPARIAIVTSSIAYEARIVLGELFDTLRRQVGLWPIAPDKRERLVEALADPYTFYDAVVTASDSSETRLKPHRDLYSIALHRLALTPDRFDRVLGLEDSESGVVAIRAAGVGLCVAVPFADTFGHSLEAACKINHGALPEVMFRDHFFLNIVE